MKITKSAVLAALAVLSFVSCARAAEQKKAEDAAEKRAQLKAFLAEKKIESIKKNGGDVVKPGSLKGSVRFINAQKRVPNDLLKKTLSVLNSQFQQDISLVESAKNVKTFADAVAVQKEAGATIAIVIAEADAMPPLLVAPENGVALVNVTVLGNAKLNEKIYASRIRKEMLRGFAAVCGASGSRYEGNVMGFAKLPDGLDELTERGVPVDVAARIQDYFTRLGITEGEWKTFREALAAGWNVEPKDEYQKAIKDRWEAEKKSSKGK